MAGYTKLFSSIAPMDSVDRAEIALGVQYRQVSYRDVPLKWLLAIDAAGQDWEGRPQQCGRWRPGTVAEAIVARRRAALVVE